MFSFDLERPGSVASNIDTARASSTPPQAPAISVDVTHIYGKPKTPSTPYDTPTHITRALGEQNAVSIFVYVSNTLHTFAGRRRLWIIDPKIDGPH